MESIGELTFYGVDQIFGGNSQNQSNIFKKYGTKAAITDFAILLGGFRSSSEKVDGKFTGYYWTKTDDGYGNARVVGYNGNNNLNDTSNRKVGSRPALPYSAICDICTNEVSVSNEITQVSCFEYPQWAVSSDMQKTLEKLYSSFNLKTLNDSFTTDSRMYHEYDKGFNPMEHRIYEYNGEKYVRVIANSYYDGEKFELSNGEKYKDGDAVWVKVESVPILVDKNTDEAVFKDIISAGVQFKLQTDYNGDFKTSDIYNYLNQYLLKDLLKQHSNIKIAKENESNDKRPNPYGFSFDSVTEEDIIRGAIESNVAVFLHGLSSEGKSSRIKQLDPDCQIIYLMNETPETLNGIKVFDSQTGKVVNIPPVWFENLKERCEKEPDKIHIVFFDEITNAYPSMQGMAYNIVLDKEVNGIWKLPENARIVAAGNDLKDSIAANQMSEPLFNRFAHVYIKTTVDSWLQWASTPETDYKRLDYENKKMEQKIHPAIYSFIAYRRDNVLRTEYNGETPNADPRKWEMASKILYSTNKPQMIRALVGETITREFCAFCNQKVVTLDNVIAGKYDNVELNMNVAEKYATIYALSLVDEENFSKVREFIKKMEPEFLNLFDNLWHHGNEKRLEILAFHRSTEFKEGGVAR